MNSLANRDRSKRYHKVKPASFHRIMSPQSSQQLHSRITDTQRATTTLHDDQEYKYAHKPSRNAVQAATHVVPNDVDDTNADVFGTDTFTVPSTTTFPATMNTLEVLSLPLGSTANCDSQY